MKVGDLVRFKVHHYHKSYGIGLVLVQRRLDESSTLPRLRVLFDGEQVFARFEELKVVSESR